MLPKIWTRYLDDISTIIDKDKINEITMEVENNGELQFLDLRIIRGEKGFPFDI